MGRQRTLLGSLTQEEREKLTAVANARSSEYRKVVRAKAILLSADGLSVKEVARRIGMESKAVIKLCKRWANSGAEAALSDSQRSGRPPVISAARTWVTEFASTCPEDLNDGADCQKWSLSSLMEYVRAHCMEKGHPDLSTCSKSTIWRILNGNTLTPHRMGYFLECQDSALEEKSQKDSPSL